MRTLLRAVAAATALLPLATAATGDEPPKPRPFLGSIAVSADRRAEVLAFLAEKGFRGAFVPDGAAPHTLLYRGTKGDYEAALDAANRHLHPEWYAPKTPLPKEKMKTPRERAAEEDQRLAASPLQVKLLAELRAESDARWAAIVKETAGKPIDLMEKGAAHNAWFRERHREVLTREQYRLWAPPFAERDLGPEPPPAKVEAGAAKSDDAIFAQLGLSPKQKAFLDALEKEVRAGRRNLLGMSDARVVRARTVELDCKWRDGLEHALTGKQLAAFRAYWDAK